PGAARPGGGHDDGVELAEGVPLDEAEGRVAEGRRDGEHGEAAAVVLEAADIVDGGRAPLLEEAEGVADVLDLEDERAHAIRVLAEEAPRPPPLAGPLRDPHL